MQRIRMGLINKVRFEGSINGAAALRIQRQTGGKALFQVQFRVSTARHAHYRNRAEEGKDNYSQQPKANRDQRPKPGLRNRK